MPSKAKLNLEIDDVKFLVLNKVDDILKNIDDPKNIIKDKLNCLKNLILKY